MNLCEIYFNKPTLEDLTFEDIKVFFEEEREETETLEFKSGHSEMDMASFNKVLADKIIRSIASFLNSSGGILIWGAPQEQAIEGKKEKFCQGDLRPINISKTKDQLINKITGEISYLPTGISLKKLENEGLFVYVFDVRESQSKPHQYMGKYFIRLDGQTQHAPHYLVDALFKQIKYPDIECYLRFGEIRQLRGLLSISVAVGIFNFSQLINEKNVSYQLIAEKGSFELSRIIHSVNHVRLNYGRPISHTHVWHITIDEFQQLDEVMFVLAVDGEKSPSKSSTYKLKCKSIQLGRFKPDEYLKEITLNKTFIDSSSPKEAVIAGFMTK